MTTGQASAGPPAFTPAGPPVAGARPWRLLGAGARRLGAADQALYAAVAASPTPWLDEPVRRLSQTANFSRLWLAIAAGIAVLGGPDGRRAALRGVIAVGVTSATVNIGMKTIRPRHRPDRAAAHVPAARQVAMPSSGSFPSGHSASGFAFASCVGTCLPGTARPLLALAAAVAYSRVYTGVHFPGDVIIGSLIGAVVGRAVASWP
ncbi:MAG: phosphatase PAP2 family protein [Trebonia sp.]|jgi:undecaprenyl-diphosphatase